MLELGNKKNDKGVYKTYFESLGIEHVSIDLNGRDGALKFDLTLPIYIEPFDMITNFGTSEHVHDQQALWQNVHHLLKVNGILVSVTPLPENWWWHGEYYPEEMFFRNFLGYKMERIGIERKYPWKLLCVRMKKISHETFMFREDLIYRNDGKSHD